MMPQFKGLSGGPHKLPDLPMEHDISGQGNQSSGKSNNGAAYTAHKSRATMGSKVLSK
jgi:hypothetical protein